MQDIRMVQFSKKKRYIQGFLATRGDVMSQKHFNKKKLIGGTSSSPRTIIIRKSGKAVGKSEEMDSDEK